MTSEELCSLLKRIDPDGNTEVVFGNICVNGACVQRANIGGYYHLVQINPNTFLPENVKYVGSGNKITLFGTSIYEAFKTDKDMKVEIIGGDPDGHNRQVIEDWRMSACDAMKESLSTPQLLEPNAPEDFGDDDYDDFEDDDEDDIEEDDEFTIPEAIRGWIPPDNG